MSVPKDVQDKEIERMREASGGVSSSDNLVKFLYLLLRDGLPAGKVEHLVDLARFDGAGRFTNGWAARHAMDIAERLRS